MAKVFQTLIFKIFISVLFASEPCANGDKRCNDLVEAVESQMGFTTTVKVATKAVGGKDCEKVSAGDATLNKMAELGAKKSESWTNFCKRYKHERELAFYASQNDGALRPDIAKKIGAPKGQRYKGCPKSVEWKNRAARGLCSGVGGRGGTPKLNAPYHEIPEALKMPDSFIFVFDGFGDFSPEKAIGSKIKPVNVKGYDTGQGHIGRANGLRSFDYLLSAPSDEYPLDIKKQQTMYFDGSNLTAGHDDEAAYKCGLEMQKDLDDLQAVFPNLKRPKMVTLGYSNGGAASLEYQEHLGRAGYSVDLAITFDPIERPVNFVARELTGFDFKKARHPDTKRLVNFYQKSDYGSMPALKLRSSELKNADVNIDVSDHLEAKEAHVRMLIEEVPVRKSRCEISKLLNEDSNIKC